MTKTKNMSKETSKRKLVYYIVDVFGSEKYSGNQLAVFTNAEGIPTTEMQKIAQEINFSETTFITGYNLDLKVFDVRIFTPFNEVPFAGHPTLGTSFIANQFFFDGKSKKINLNLQVGKIPVEILDDILWMNQIQPTFGETIDSKTLAEVLGLQISDIDHRYPAQIVSTGLPFILICLNSLDALKRCNLNSFAVKEKLQKYSTNEIMVLTTEAYNPKDQIACRVFVPEFGIPEDAATGSANGCLSAYLLKYKILEKSNIDISVGQGYEMNRPSTLFHKSSLSGNKFDINIGGTVIPIAEGLWY